MFDPPAHSTQHRSRDRAVSPVIGVVLMVAITIILAAIIGAFVLGFSPGSSAVAPMATVTFDGGENLTIQHEGGDPLDLEEHTLLVDGEDETPTAFNTTFRSGETMAVDVDGDGDDVELVLRHDPTGDIVARGTVDLD